MRQTANNVKLVHLLLNQKMQRSFIELIGGFLYLSIKLHFPWEQLLRAVLNLDVSYLEDMYRLFGLFAFNCSSVSPSPKHSESSIKNNYGLWGICIFFLLITSKSQQFDEKNEFFFLLDHESCVWKTWSWKQLGPGKTAGTVCCMS